MRRAVEVVASVVAGAAIAVAAGLFVAGDAAGDPALLDECRMTFAVGATVRPEQTVNGCAGADGSTTVYGTGTIECPDGRTLTYNNLAVWNPDGLVVAEFVKGFGVPEYERWCSQSD